MKVLNYLLLTFDRGNCRALVLLDLSAAFNTIDHSTLLHSLQTFVSPKGPSFKSTPFKPR